MIGLWKYQKSGRLFRVFKKNAIIEGFHGEGDFHFSQFNVCINAFTNLIVKERLIMWATVYFYKGCLLTYHDIIPKGGDLPVLLPFLGTIV